MFFKRDSRNRTPAATSAVFWGAVCLMILGFGEASAQSSATWTGGGGSGSWSNSANWSTLPTTAGTWQLTFGGNTQPTSNNDIGTINLTTLTFSNDGALGQTSTFTLSGSTLGLSNGVISTVSVSGLPVNEDAIGNGLLMSGSSTIVLGTGHNLTIAGDISGLGASLTKSGAGQLFLTGSNSYTGTTYITNGTVRTGSTGPNASFNNYALGTGDVVVSGSSMLEVRNSSTVSNNLTISGVGSSASGMQAGPLNGSFGASNQTAVVSGSVTLAGDAIISTWGTAGVVNSKLLLSGPVDIGSHALTFRRVPQAASTFIEVGGAIGGSGTVTVDGDGASVYLNGANTYTGATTVLTGTLGGSGTLVSDVTVKTGATITPGSAANTTGALGVGALVLESGATAAMSISGTSIGLFDQIVAVNNVTYGGTLAIDFTTDAFANFDAWQLFSGAGHDGHFSSVVATGPGAFSNLTFSYLGDGEWQATGGSLADGQTLSFYENNHHALGGKYLAGQLILVPEPSAIVGAGIGLLVVGWRRWSKRRGGRRSGDSIAAV